VREVEGDFGRGDLVRIADTTGMQVGLGLANYSAAELAKIKGAKSSEIAKLLGYRYGDEVVHRNDLVMYSEITALMAKPKETS
jgi:glutamate 5-kinase